MRTKYPYRSGRFVGYILVSILLASSTEEKNTLPLANMLLIYEYTVTNNTLVLSIYLNNIISHLYNKIV